MVLGALIDVGLSARELEEYVRTVLSTGWALSVEEAEHNAVYGTRVQVTVDADQPRWSWATFQILIEQSSLPATMKTRAFAIAERVVAPVNRVSPERLHDNEAVPVDSMAAIVGAAVGFELLGIERAWSLPVGTGDAFVAQAAGRKLLTPTGAAMLAALAPDQPALYRPHSVGMGFGSWRLPWPNALRLYLCD